MGKLLSTIANSVGQLGNVTLILVLVIYMLAVVGVKVFGKMYTPEAFGEDGVPRWNFKDFPHAFMMVFRILCGEWIEPLWDCMRVTNPASILFFVPAFVIGNFIVSIKKDALTNILQNFGCHEAFIFSRRQYRDTRYSRLSCLNLGTAPILEIN